MFSPYYRLARRRQPLADPAQHCAVNVALYGPGRGRWAMTERGAPALQREARTLRIGPSQLHWDGQMLAIDLDEVCFPLPGRIRGEIRVHPQALATQSWTLDAEGRHRWRPIAPSAGVELRLGTPALRWSGHGYLDSNAGDAPIEDSIQTWDWSRSRLRERSAVIYDVRARDGTETSLALAFDRHGQASPIETPPRLQLPGTGWRIAREARAEAGEARVLRTLEDTPFYARSVIESRLLGERAIGVHESLDLDRFRRGIVQAMLPFRMPRRSGWRER